MSNSTVVQSRRIYEKIRNSRCPLSAVKDLNQNGMRLSVLNELAEIGSLLCDIVRVNYGLGIQILIDAGLNVSLPVSEMLGLFLVIETRYLYYNDIHIDPIKEIR